MVYELTALKPPFLAKNIKDLHTKVLKGDYPRIPKHFSLELQYVIDLCLTQDHVKRPTAEELLNLDYFRDQDEQITSPKLDLKSSKAKLQAYRSQSQNQ